MSDRSEKYASPFRLLALTMVSVFVVELGIMLVLQYVYQPPQFIANIIDGTLLAVIMYPILYYFAFKPLTREIEHHEVLKSKLEVANADLLKFKLAVDNASDHVIITDPDAVVLYVNKACEKITGFLPEEILGQKAGKLWGNLMGRPFYEDLWKTIKIDKKVFTSQMTNQRKNGSRYEVSVSISPILNERDEIIFFVGLERDITRERQIDTAKGEFISLASHQMRTPLTAINWYAEMLLNNGAGELSKKQEEFVGEIYVAAQRMNEIIKAFLHILRLETGSVVLSPSPTDLKAILGAILEEFKLNIAEKKVRIVEHYQDVLPLVSVDQDLVRVVLQNLISNAIKYSLENGTVTLSLEYVSVGSVAAGKKVSDDALLVSVADTGIGISAEDRDRMFTKFFRTESAKKQDPNGNGLGLYMAKIMSDIIGGTLWFTSEQGRGATFHLLLPTEARKAV